VTADASRGSSDNGHLSFKILHDSVPVVFIGGLTA
jgi:hypothetical protein